MDFDDEDIHFVEENKSETKVGLIRCLGLRTD